MTSEVQRATASHCPRSAWTGGFQGNQGLIALTGIALLTLLIVEGLVATPVSTSRFHRIADRMFHLAPVAPLGAVCGFTR